MIELRVKFKKKLFGSLEGDYSIFSAEPATSKDLMLVDANKYGSISISGDYFITEDEMKKTYKLTIEEDYGSKYPNSYKLIRLHYEFPTEPSEQWSYLKDSGLVPLRTFMEISKQFSSEDKILDIITEEPERLEKVNGVGASRAKDYQSKLLENKDKAVLFAEYGKIDGVGAKLIDKFYFWKSSVVETVKLIKEEPFAMVQELDVSFVTADRFRDFYKIPLNDKDRILHGVRYFLNEYFSSTGNTYEDILEVGKIIARKLNVSYKEVILFLAEIKDDKIALDKYSLKIFGRNITTNNLFTAELMIYEKMREMIKEKKPLISTEEWKKNKDEYLSSLDAELSDEQDLFLDTINDYQVSILLGPGGAGKSWVINIASELIKSAGKTFALFAPTARAAKVMSGYVGTEAKTIHRGLMKHTAIGEIAPYDFLIVDEFSMVDSELGSTIVAAMGQNTRLIIVGDDYQLQSVGPGNVLLDLVQSVGVNTTRLTKIFRQADANGLLDYAQALRDGTFELPLGNPKIEDNNIVFINETDDSRKQEIALKLYKDSLDRVDGDSEDVMLLTPSNKGPSGRKSMNKKIQDIVNPSDGKNEAVIGANGSPDSKRSYRKDDYITVTSNQYEMTTDVNTEKSIINGDLGKITRANKETITFKIEKDSYTIEKSSITGLIDHAWAITIHKSQGGQASEVIIVIPENSNFMLNANMIYTAITRAKVKCYVICNFRELNKAAKRQANLSRKTMIQLQGERQKKKDAAK